MQIDRLQKAADDARHQLESKENIVKELSRDGSKLDKERYAAVSGFLYSRREFLCKLEMAFKLAEDAAMSVVLSLCRSLLDSIGLGWKCWQHGSSKYADMLSSPCACSAFKRTKLYGLPQQSVHKTHVQVE